MPDAGEVPGGIAIRALAIRAAIDELQDTCETAGELEFRRLNLQVLTLMAAVIDELAGIDSNARLQSWAAETG